MAREVMGRFDGEDEEEEPQPLPPRVSSQSVSKGKRPASANPKSGQVKDMTTLFTREGIKLQFQIVSEELAQYAVNEIEENINEHGGEITEDYGQADYVLVNQTTETGANIISTHTSPTRHVVSTDFVSESIKRRQLVPYSELSLFIKEDKPVRFHLHESLDEFLGEAEANRLRDCILLRGGNPYAEPRNADVLIYHSRWKGEAQMKDKFKNIIRLETHEWFNSCIERNRFTLGLRIKEVYGQTLKPGRKPGSSRTEFSQTDDMYLIAWIATHFRYSRAGRQGNKAYEDMVEIPDYKSWSHRHTWQSWRERYKNKRKQFDPLIEAYIVEHGLDSAPNDQEVMDMNSTLISAAQGRYTNATRRKIGSKRKAQDDDEEDDDNDNDDEDEDRESDGSSNHRNDTVVKASSLQSRQAKRPKAANTASKERAIKISASQKAARPAPAPAQAPAPAPAPASRGSSPPIDPTSPRDFSPPNNPTPPRALSPILPPTNEALPATPIKQSQSQPVAPELQEESQDSTVLSESDDTLSDTLVSPGSRAMMDTDFVRIKKTIDKYGLATQDEREEYVEDEVDVGGPSQFELSPPPGTNPDESQDEHDVIEQQLSRIAAKHGVPIVLVRTHFQEVEDEAPDLERALDMTREYIQQFADSRKGQAM